MKKISIRNKYKNKNNSNKKNIDDYHNKEDNNNNNNNNIDLSSKDINNDITDINKNKQDDNLNKTEDLKEKNKIKKISPETSQLMGSYKNEIENELQNSVTGYKGLKENKSIEQMMKLLQLIKICNTMNIVKNDKSLCEIIPHLYISSFAGASNLEELKSKNITHIVCCGLGLKAFFPDQFKYHKINLIDKETENIRKYFDETNKFINDAMLNNGNILVHCYAGISRSTSIIIAYLMKHQKMNFNKALELIKEKRGKIQPNSGFILQLKAYEKELGY